MSILRVGLVTYFAKLELKKKYLEHYLNEFCFKIKIATSKICLKNLSLACFSC